MADRKAPKEIFQEYNTLVLIPTLLVGHNTIVDMRNETSVAGTIDNVDGFMNITMTNAVFIDQKNFQHNFDLFHIPARMIRYVHIPDSINVKQLMENHLTKQFAIRSKPKIRIKSQKILRAERNHLKTLQELTVRENATKQN